jgi:hypothetical protein
MMIQKEKLMKFILNDEEGAEIEKAFEDAVSCGKQIEELRRKSTDALVHAQSIYFTACLRVQRETGTVFEIPPLLSPEGKLNITVNKTLELEIPAKRIEEAPKQAVSPIKLIPKEVEDGKNDNGVADSESQADDK